MSWAVRPPSSRLCSGPLGGAIELPSRVFFFVPHPLHPVAVCMACAVITRPARHFANSDTRVRAIVFRYDAEPIRKCVFGTVEQSRMIFQDLCSVPKVLKRYHVPELYFVSPSETREQHDQMGASETDRKLRAEMEIRQQIYEGYYRRESTRCVALWTRCRARQVPA